MISYVQALILGLLQGATELFPVSSLGHSVILPRLFGWDIHQNDEDFVTFLVATHFATAATLFIYFWDDWRRILAGLWRSVRSGYVAHDDTDAKLGLLLIAATIPAGLIGLVLEHKLRSLFASPESASIFLFFNGVMLLGAERLRKRAPATAADDEDIDSTIVRRLSLRNALGIGIAQAVALIPGFSRSGASMGGGLLAGLSNEEAARFSFLLATPIIGAAAVLKLPHLAGSSGDGIRGPALVGAIGAAFAAYLSVRFLLRFFETNRLTPFGTYCVVVGGLLTIVLGFI